ncbi:MAG: FeoB-associated Cys-rich membrane protein [Candidatus Scatomorpha sp.]
MAQNWASLVVGLVVLAAVVLAFWKVRHDKKRGTGGCSCDCGSCGACGGACHDSRAGH